MALSRSQNNTIVDSRFVEANRYQEIHVHGPPKDSLQVLREWTVSRAFHNSGERFDPPKCHPDTRVAILDRLACWASRGHKATPIFWLRGPAGAGKSAIAQTLAERWDEEGRLAASFFFSRTDGKRAVKTHLVATIVYQLLNSFPEIRAHIESIISDDPLIFEKSLETQILRLVRAPLMDLRQNRPSPMKKVVIIDGLDECHGAVAQAEILSIWALALKNHDLPLILLVASRPEPDIYNAFAANTIARLTDVATLDDRLDPSRDITLFLECKFLEIKEKRPWLKKISWPPRDAISTITAKSSGQFIYAATVMKYINTPRGDPRRCLDIVLGLKPSGNETPFAELDALYSYILSQIPYSSLETVLNVLTCVATPYDEYTDHVGGWLFPDPGSSFKRLSSRTPSSLEKFLILEPGHIYMHLADLHSLLNVPPIENEFLDIDNVTPYHASLADFLSDKSRAQSFHIGTMEKHTRIMTCIWKHVVLGLSKPSDHPPFFPAVPENRLSLREHILIRSLHRSSLTKTLMQSIEAALSTDESRYIEDCERLGIAQRISGKKQDLFNFIGSCDIKDEILFYLERCRADVRMSCWKRILSNRELARWRRRVDEDAKSCQRNCTYHS